MSGIAGYGGDILHRAFRCQFLIDGEEFPVSKATLSLTLNGIPECSVGIAPPGKGEDENGKTPVTVFNLGPLKELYDRLVVKARDLVKCRFAVGIEDFVSAEVSSPTMQPELFLNDWLLRDVGIDQVTTTGAFSLVCQIVHPAYRLMSFPGFFFDSTNAVEFSDDDLEEATDVLAAARKAMEVVREYNGKEVSILSHDIWTPSEGGKRQDAIVSDIREAVDQAIKYIGDEALIVWDGEFSHAKAGVPFGEVVEGRHLNAVKYALMRFAAHEADGATVWDMLNRIRGSFGCDIVPTYDRTTLKLVPSNPWKEPTVDIPGNYTSVAVFPGKDPSPIYGIATLMGVGSGPANGTVSLQRAKAAGIFHEPCNLAYVPAKSDYANGGFVVRRSPPGWFGDMTRYLGKPSKDDRTVAMADTGRRWGGSFEATSAPTAADEDTAEINTILGTDMANLFMLSYRCQVRASLQCAYMPMTVEEDSRVIYPGMNARFAAGEDGKTMFSGEIMSMTHIIDFARSVAYTNIVLQYCRGEADDPILGESPSCPMYGTSPSASTSE